MQRHPPKKELEFLYETHHRLERLDPDPLIYGRGYDDPLDGEVAGLIAAGFAYGRVEKIVEALGIIFTALGESPRKALENLDPVDFAHRMEGFTYRFHKGKDVAIFLTLLSRALEKWQSFESIFNRHDAGGSVAVGMSGLGEAILGGDPRPLLQARKLPAGHPVRHLCATPAKGGAAKRLCLFMRWMCRSDQLDPGYWADGPDPSRLVVPLDVHVARVGRALGFTDRKAADWKTACEITEALKKYDPGDPLRYDFSLFRFGMDRH